MVSKYETKGYSQQQAQAKTCQDIILYKIANSNLSSNITLKGGIVLFNITKNIRRTTNDIDLDFIKYSIDDDSINLFIDNLNKVNDGFLLRIEDEIIPLHHDAYQGKRVSLIVKDSFNNELKTKLDIGVHNDICIKQEKCLFVIDSYDCNVNLLINTPEQIFTEKLKSLMLHGVNSTRYKDIYDLYYLINNLNLSKEIINNYLKIMIFDDNDVNINNIDELNDYFNEIVNDDLYRSKLLNPKVKWIDEDIDQILETLCDYINELK